MSQLSSTVSLPRLAYKGVPVVTTETLALAYEVDAVSIRKNFSCNKERFTEGKHFYSISGNELREFKNCVTESNSVGIGKRTSNLTLWTERGAARHAKMLNSDKAWDMFELLEETFFRVAVKQVQEALELTPADRSDLKALVDAKLSTCPAHLQGKARSELWARFNRHFRIAEYAQLPQEKMSEARDYSVELELRALRPVEARKTRALPAAPAPAVSKQEKTVIMLKEVMDMVKDAYHPGVISLAMTPEKRTRYYQRHSLYCSATDCLLAACRILETEKELAGEACAALPAPRSRGLKGDMKELSTIQSKLELLMQTVQFHGLRGYSTGDEKVERDLVQSQNAHIRTAVNCLIMAKLALAAAMA